MTEPCKVLVVDDEPLLRHLVLSNFEDRIESNELRFYFAGNGVEALEILEKEKDIVIVITDIKMPEMNGLELLKNLASQDRVYRSAVVTAYGDMKNIREAMGLGVSDFITKPFDFRDLDQTLSKIIAQYNEYLLSSKAKLADASLQKELMIAQDIQESLSPKDFNPLPQFSDVIDVFGKIYPAEEISGSFFDFLPQDDLNLLLFAGDTSGKGVPASLFLTMTMTLVRGFVVRKNDLSTCLEHVNEPLCYYNKSKMSINVFLGSLDIMKGILTYSNAGYTIPLIISKEGIIKTIQEQPEMPLGIQKVDYTEFELKLIKNDTILFYSRAVVEARNKSNEVFGEERLKQFLIKSLNKNLTEITYNLKQEIDNFSENNLQTGDISIFFLRFHGFR